MYQEEIVLCSASKYTEKYYLNPDFEGLPELVRQELQIMCVLYTEDVGGVILLYFDEDDILYDEIGSVLKIKQMQREKEELFEQLEQYYKVFFLNED